MRLAAWDGVSVSPKLSGMREVFRKVEKLARFRSRVRSPPPWRRRVTLVGESETPMPTRVSPRAVFCDDGLVARSHRFVGEEEVAQDHLGGALEFGVEIGPHREAFAAGAVAGGAESGEENVPGLRVGGGGGFHRGEVFGETRFDRGEAVRGGRGWLGITRGFGTGFASSSPRWRISRTFSGTGVFRERGEERLELRGAAEGGEQSREMDQNGTALARFLREGEEESLFPSRDRAGDRGVHPRERSVLFRQGQQGRLGARIAALSETERGLQGEGGREGIDEAGREEIVLDSAGEVVPEMIGVGGTEGSETFRGIAAFPPREIERGDRRPLLEEEPTRRLAPPEKGAFRLRLERRAVEAGERGSGRDGGFVRLEDPDPSAVVAVDDAVLLLEVPRDRRIVLDDLAVEVDDGEAAPRCVRERDGWNHASREAKPFAFFLALDALEPQTGSVPTMRAR